MTNPPSSFMPAKLAEWRAKAQAGKYLTPRQRKMTSGQAVAPRRIATHGRVSENGPSENKITAQASSTTKKQQTGWWDRLHGRITKDNLPPHDILLSDADTVAVLLVAAQGHLTANDLHSSWPAVFSVDGGIQKNRRPAGMPAVVYHAGDEGSPDGYHYLTYNHEYTLCGHDYIDGRHASAVLGQGWSWLNMIEDGDTIETAPRLQIFDDVFLTINRHCKVDWDCIRAPSAVSWKHTSKEMQLMVTENPRLFSKTVARRYHTYHGKVDEQDPKVTVTNNKRHLFAHAMEFPCQAGIDKEPDIQYMRAIIAKIKQGGLLLVKQEDLDIEEFVRRATSVCSITADRAVSAMLADHVFIKQEDSDEVIFVHEREVRPGTSVLRNGLEDDIEALQQQMKALSTTMSVASLNLPHTLSTRRDVKQVTRVVADVQAALDGLPEVIAAEQEE